MSTANFKRCENCGVVRDSNDTFCGACGKPFGISSSGNNYPTVLSGELPSTRNSSTEYSTQPHYTPVPPTQPVYSPRSTLNKVYLTIIAVLVVALIGTGLFIGIQIGKGGTPATTGNVNTPNASQQSGITPASNSPTTATTNIVSTPTGIPSPTPILTVSPGTVICKSGASDNWAGWQIAGSWKILNGELLYDGTGNGAQLVAPASCQPTTSNYAVDVKMRIVSGCCHFGIIVRGNASSNGYTGYQVSIYTTTYQNLGINTLGGQGGAAAGYSFDNNFHDWRAYVKDNVINFVIDGSKVLSLTDNTYLSPGEVSICCTDTMQLDIASFQVTAL